MRVHRLEIEAFGAFVDRQVVDVDVLSAQHLFLLHGETGAGKTTVLDALCFALYGEVPGARNGAAHLRSDHAPPQAEPRVAVEVTVRGRRFRLTRTPKWERPKKRGTGNTTAQASVTCVELVGGEWVHISSRIPETNQQMIELIGLTREQFCQVVLLPQGQFASFLRAGSDERRTLLQKIFSTSRFADVERWLVDRRIQAKRESDRHHNVVRELFARLSESAGTPWPEVWPTDDVTEAAATGDLHEFAEELVAGTTLAHARAHRSREETGDQVAALRAEHADGARLAEQAARARSAQAVLHDLDGRGAHLREVLARCESARRAEPVIEARRHAVRARVAAMRASQAADEAGAGARSAMTMHGCKRSPGSEDLTHERTRVETALRAAADRRGEAAALVSAERDLHDAERRSSSLERECAELTDAVVALEADLEELPAQRAALVTSIEALRPLVAIRPELAVAAETAASRLTAAAEVAARNQQVAAAEREVLECRERAADRRDAWHECRERRFAGMASEIALKLAVGHGCPVCGSCEHPSPAPHDRVEETRAAEEAARQAFDDATVHQQVAEQTLAGLRSHRDAAVRSSEGLDEATARSRWEEAACRLHRADEAAVEMPAQQSRLDELDDRRRQFESAMAEKRSRLAARGASLDAAREQAEAAGARVAEALATFREQADASVADVPLAPATTEVWAQWFGRHVEALRGYADTLVHLASTQQLKADAEALLDGAVEASGFADAETAAHAHLDEHSIVALTAELEEAGRERHTAEATLAEMPAEIYAVLEGRSTAPDLTDLTSRLAASERRHRAAIADAEAALGRRTRVGQLATALCEALEAWAPVREHYRVLTDLAAAVEGKGADNPFQMRLSAYVLASRLSQVVAAANERLSSMAEQRYELEHTAFKGAGDRRGGLSLRVVDAWTGEARDPATLSGGETFVVALALALGLADVVTAESGGAEIETLFVDEGFGSLDPHTLDRVMDCLDDLRSGGRSVGVVSHVSELRDRIPDQLHIIKTATGSQVQMRLAAGAPAL